MRLSQLPNKCSNDSSGAGHGRRIDQNSGEVEESGILIVCEDPQAGFGSLFMSVELLVLL